MQVQYTVQVQYRYAPTDQYLQGRGISTGAIQKIFYCRENYKGSLGEYRIVSLNVFHQR